MRFTKPKKVIGLDVGTHSVKAVLMSWNGLKWRIDDVGYALVDRSQVNLDPILAHSNAVRAAIKSMPANQSTFVGALSGQTAVVRHSRLPEMPDEQLRQAIEGEAAQNIPYDLFEVALDWSSLGVEGEGDERQLKVLMVAAKHEVIDARIQVASAAEVEFGVLGVDTLALSDAAEGCEFLRTGETVALVNIGAASVNVHFVKDGVSNFVRDANWGAKELIQAIAKCRHCDYDEAEKILYNIEEELEKEAPETASLEAETLPATDELVEPEPVSAGSGSFIDSLDDEEDSFLEPAMPSAVSEPAGMETMGATADMDDEAGLEQALALPISRLINETRRSFDFYEHQLYESPVDRIILSGGIAHLQLIRSAFASDLGVENVQVADPTDGALEVAESVDAPEFAQYPALFMVAVGLAVRGLAEI